MLHTTVVRGDGYATMYGTNNAGIGFQSSYIDYACYVGKAANSPRSASMAVAGNGTSVENSRIITLTARGRTNAAETAQLYALDSVTHPAFRAAIGNGSVFMGDIDVIGVEVTSASNAPTGKVAAFKRRIVCVADSAALKATQTYTGASDVTETGFVPAPPTITSYAGGSIGVTVTGLANAGKSIRWRVSIHGVEFEVSSLTPDS